MAVKTAIPVSDGNEDAFRQLGKSHARGQRTLLPTKALGRPVSLRSYKKIPASMEPGNPA